jgi:hypothetical protein
MRYIQERLICRELTQERPRFIYESYPHKYRTFVEIGGKTGRDLRAIDRLFTFGKFLKLARPFA